MEPTRDATVRGTRLVRLFATLVVGGVMLGPAACGGSDSAKSSSSTSGGSSNGGTASDQAVKYAECMRENGVPGFPDPQNGRLVLRAGEGGVDPNSPKFQSAQRKCRSLAPSGLQAGGGGGQATQDSVLKFARCMRKNGVPNFPDPQVQGGGAVLGQAGDGVDTNSPSFKSAQSKCSSLLTGGGSDGTP
jgi:hypothetical protein